MSDKVHKEYKIRRCKELIREDGYTIIKIKHFLKLTKHRRFSWLFERSKIRYLKEEMGGYKLDKQLRETELKELMEE